VQLAVAPVPRRARVLHRTAVRLANVPGQRGVRVAAAARRRQCCQQHLQRVGVPAARVRV
jgi:hypothetical protein